MVKSFYDSSAYSNVDLRIRAENRKLIHKCVFYFVPVGCLSHLSTCTFFILSNVKAGLDNAQFSSCSV